MRQTSVRRAPQRKVIDRTLGERAPLVPGACPRCFRVVAISASGRRRAHRDQQGAPCTGSGILTEDHALELTELPPVMVGPERVDSGVERQHSYIDGRRIALNGRGVCSTCRRELPLNSDGQIRKHRTRHQDPLAPYCTGVAA